MNARTRRRPAAQVIALDAKVGETAPDGGRQRTTRLRSTRAAMLGSVGLVVALLGGMATLIPGVAGAAVITGDSRANLLVGGGGADRIAAGAGDDDVDGRGGDDRVFGGRGGDDIGGGDGDDLIIGGPGGDDIDGDAGDDRIRAVDGRHDDIDCGSGADRVWADRGDDVDADCEVVVRRSRGGTGVGAPQDDAVPVAPIGAADASRIGARTADGVVDEVDRERDGRVAWEVDVLTSAGRHVVALSETGDVVGVSGPFGATNPRLPVSVIAAADAAEIAGTWIDGTVTDVDFDHDDGAVWDVEVWTRAGEYSVEVNGTGRVVRVEGPDSD